MRKCIKAENLEMLLVLILILVLIFRLVNRFDLVEMLVMKISVMSSQLFLTKPISLYLRLC